MLLWAGLPLVLVSRGSLWLWCTGFSWLWVFWLWNMGSRKLGLQWLQHVCLVFKTPRLWKSRTCGTPAYAFHGMRDLPGPGIKPISPALAGGFLSPEPPGKLQREHFLLELLKETQHVWVQPLTDELNPTYLEVKEPEHKCQKKYCDKFNYDCKNGPRWVGVRGGEKKKSWKRFCICSFSDTTVCSFFITLFYYSFSWLLVMLFFFNAFKDLIIPNGGPDIIHENTGITVGLEWLFLHSGEEKKLHLLPLDGCGHC